MNYLSKPGIEINQDAVIKTVCRKYNVTFDQLKQRNRAAGIVIPRHIAIYVLRNRLKMKLIDIAKVFNISHSTVVHSCMVINNEIFFNSEIGKAAIKLSE